MNQRLLLQTQKHLYFFSSTHLSTLLKLLKISYVKNFLSVENTFDASDDISIPKNNFLFWRKIAQFDNNIQSFNYA